MQEVLETPSDTISIPPGQFESPRPDVRSIIDTYLEMPERFGRNDIPQKLARFLTDHEYIRNIDVLRNSWGFKYDSREKTIYISEHEISAEEYNYYIFHLGHDAQSGERLRPTLDETDQYRFLHELSHVYQEYLMDKSGHRNWYDSAIANKTDSPAAQLYRFCFSKREEDEHRGLSTWGNVRDYDDPRLNLDHMSRIGTRAMEDANELVTMYLWNPQYFSTYLDYLSGEFPGFGAEDVTADGLTPISRQERETLAFVVSSYVDEMKRTIIQ